MAKDFFDGLGESFAKTMREIGGRAESLYSEQKLKNKISGEEKQIAKIMEELGKIIYRRYRGGVPLEDMQRRLCEQIDQRMERISQYKEEIAGVKSKKLCPSCGATVEMGMAFCPHCGTACTTKETEEHTDDVVADATVEEIIPEETVVESDCKEESVTEDAEEVEENSEEPEDSVVDAEEVKGSEGKEL